MFNQLLAACNNRYLYEKKHCTGNKCTYAGFCPNTGECGSCLKLVHFPDRVKEDAPQRQYDCTHMADYYVCKYACKYISELIYAFVQLQDLKNKRTLKVLSFGCGPCTDLLALDHLRQQQIYSYDTLEYRGVDYGRDVWANIHNDISTMISEDDIVVKFYYNDVIKLISTIANGTWIPDLVVFQYFFSDMNKNSPKQEIANFMNTFAKYANTKMGDCSYIVFNDINLSVSYGGGREYFDRIHNLLDGGCYTTGHFHNEIRPNTYEYGQIFPDNSLFFDINGLTLYQPFESCSSAQMIYKKGDTSL
jgi:hypothetical protein